MTSRTSGRVSADNHRSQPQEKRKPLSFEASTFALPGKIRQRMESLFAADLSQVRICLAEKPLPGGAAALASGHRIYFSPGHWQPDTVKGQAMIAHEVAHLFQQQSLEGSEQGMLIDTGLEAEANLFACLSVMQASVPGQKQRRTGSRRISRGSSAVWQPWIMMAAETGDDPSRYGQADYQPQLRFGQAYFRAPEDGRGKPYDERFVQLTNYAVAAEGVDRAYRFLFNGAPPPIILQILKVWMGLLPEAALGADAQGDVLAKSASMGRRIELEVRGEFRYYHTYGELAWALERERKTFRELQKEDAAAAVVLEDRRVQARLQSLATRVADFFAGNEEAIRAKSAARATYATLHGCATFADVVTALRQRGTVSKLIALLHDAKDLMSKTGLIDPTERSFQLHVNEGRTALDISKYQMRYNVGTPDEADDWVLWMRDHNRPVWAGPSYTMFQMWNMAATVAAEEPEMESLAYAMFAFWNTEYPHEATPIHRFHGVMAGAEVFGIPYNPDADAWLNCAAFLERLQNSRAKL